MKRRVDPVTLNYTLAITRHQSVRGASERIVAFGLSMPAPRGECTTITRKMISPSGKNQRKWLKGVFAHYRGLYAVWSILFSHSRPKKDLISPVGKSSTCPTGDTGKSSHYSTVYMPSSHSHNNADRKESHSKSRHHHHSSHRGDAREKAQSRYGCMLHTDVSKSGRLLLKGGANCGCRKHPWKIDIFIMERHNYAMDHL